MRDRPQRTRQGPVTLLDVAAAAGVSKSSASRFLDERLPQSDSETARRVRQVAAEIGYMRDVSAASLRRGKTMTIGVVVPRLTDTVMAMFYEALARACRRSGQFAIVATSDDEPDGDHAAVEALLHRRVDGLVLSTARMGDDFFKELTARGVPYVLALRTNGSSLASVGDDRLGGYLATRHLLDLGHRRIGLIAGPAYASTARGRAEGYRQAMAEAGAEVDPAWVVEVHLRHQFRCGSGASADEPRLPDRPRCSRSTTTPRSARCRRSRSWALSVPEDVSLVGYNDIPIVSRLPTPLTSVRVPFDQIAAAALDLLASGPEGEHDRIRVSPRRR